MPEQPEPEMYFDARNMKNVAENNIQSELWKSQSTEHHQLYYWAVFSVELSRSKYNHVYVNHATDYVNEIERIPHRNGIAANDYMTWMLDKLSKVIPKMSKEYVESFRYQVHRDDIDYRTPTFVRGGALWIPVEVQA